MKSAVFIKFQPARGAQCRLQHTFLTIRDLTDIKYSGCVQLFKKLIPEFSFRSSQGYRSLPYKKLIKGFEAAYIVGTQRSEDSFEYYRGERCYH